MPTDSRGNALYARGGGYDATIDSAPASFPDRGDLLRRGIAIYSEVLGIAPTYSSKDDAGFSINGYSFDIIVANSPGSISLGGAFGCVHL